MLSNLLIQTAGKTLKGKQSYRPRPSNAGPERCLRSLVYHAMGIPESNTIGDRAAMTMDDSSWHEELSADWIRKMEGYSLLDQQLEVGVDGMTGHIDGILHTPEGPYLWEHKALNHFGWGRYANGSADPLDYFTQCAFYIKALSTRGISFAILLIKNKNTSQYLDYVMHYIESTDTLMVTSKEVSGESKNTWNGVSYPNIIGSALDRFRQVDQYVAHNELPDRPHEIGCNFPCGYCTWEDTCWAEHEEEIRALGQLGEIPIEHEEHYKYHLEAAMHKKNAEDEYEALKPESVRLLLATGCRVAKCGKYTVSYQSRKKDGKTTSEWVRVTLKEGK